MCPKSFDMERFEGGPVERDRLLSFFARMAHGIPHMARRNPEEIGPAALQHLSKKAGMRSSAVNFDEWNAKLSEKSVERFDKGVT